MEHDVLIALLSLAGTLTGTLGGILTSARLTNYRIEQLEKKFGIPQKDQQFVRAEIERQTLK